MNPDFSNLSILVIGDLMLDKYLFGAVNRISPEAPVPVLSLNKQSHNLGGAANVAANLIGLGVKATLLGALGNDDDSVLCQKLCDQNHINLLSLKRSIPTITKTRVIGGAQQMLRIDNEEIKDLAPHEIDQVKDLLIKTNESFSAIIISDYGKGFCTEALCQFFIKFAQQKNIPTFIDPKGNQWDKYAGANYITPNFKEFCDYLKHNGPNEASFIEDYSLPIIEKGLSENLLITRSEKGMSLCNKNGFIHSGAKAQKVFDVSGAGDTVIATLATAIAANWPTSEALELANKAAGIVVGQLGTKPIDKLTLHQNRPLSSYLTLNELKDEMKKRPHQKAIFTNGCFDLLHRGHLDYLKKARQLGDYLIVALNSDESVRKLKGPERPINSQIDRATLLSALEFVDYVVVFEEDTPQEILSELKPYTLVKGGDYTLEQVIGREHVSEVVLIDFVEGYSSTKIIKKIMES